LEPTVGYHIQLPQLDAQRLLPPPRQPLSSSRLEIVESIIELGHVIVEPCPCSCLSFQLMVSSDVCMVSPDMFTPDKQSRCGLA
jgi:hypothetical protein